MELFVWIFIASPWFAGGLLGVYAGKRRNLNAGENLILFAAGSFFFLVAQGTLIWIGATTGLTSAESVIAGSLVASAVSCCYIFFQQRHLLTTMVRDTVWLPFRQPLLLLVGAEFFLMLAQAAWMPSQAWDFLWYRADIGLFLLNPQGPESVTPWVKFMVHPPVPEALAMSSAWASFQFSTNGPHMLYWLLIWLTITLTVSGYGYSETSSLRFGLILALLTMSLPLLQNHIALSGYAEPFVVAGLVVSVASLASYIKTKSKLMLFIGLFSALCVLFLKNVGLLYSISILSAFFLTLTASSLRYTSGRKIGTVVCVVSLLLLLSWWYIGNELFSNGIQVFGRFLEPSKATFYDILVNQSHALLKNQSFSLVFLIYCLSFFFVFRALGQLMYRELFLWLCSTLVLVLLSFSQLTSWGYTHAMPDNDTGNSRFSLNFIALAVFNLVTLYRMSLNPSNANDPIRASGEGSA